MVKQHKKRSNKWSLSNRVDSVQQTNKQCMKKIRLSQHVRAIKFLWLKIVYVGQFEAGDGMLPLALQ